ncbi:hypothetical protein TCON_0438 [Astathelohania contejeani]|uniref:SHSP domain-containing protein n=1 Tax=Astathelohania contejeani TaxID=164912 RepID=A0ABQ7I1S6_9MICR|nr:hypothetical protein TCON_0438 [Thelohania contejeani]
MEKSEMNACKIHDKIDTKTISLPQNIDPSSIVIEYGPRGFTLNYDHEEGIKEGNNEEYCSQRVYMSETFPYYIKRVTATHFDGKLVLNIEKGEPITRKPSKVKIEDKRGANNRIEDKYWCDNSNCIAMTSGGKEACKCDEMDSCKESCKCKIPDGYKASCNCDTVEKCKESCKRDPKM